ncbi:MAG TPA: hypothetical protein VLA59_02920 [Patescibacteria group bacterium]|nr:hypothetical protein [Patescibacteria group bacterium]
MTGRILAIAGWLAWVVARPFRRTPLRRFPGAPATALAVLLLVLAALPIVLPQLDPQPADVAVDEIISGAVTEPGTWVRLTGRAYGLDEPPTDGGGSYALLIDEAQRLRAIVVRGPDPFETAPSEVVSGFVTGRLVEANVVVDEELPIEATEAGTPPRIAADRIVELDAVAKVPRSTWWPLAILPGLLAILLLVGSRTPYPVFRRTRVVDVLAAPLGPGERLPAAYGGRIGPNERELADPGGVLLLVRRGPKGNLLTAQPLPDDGGVAPAPVTIGGGWTSGRIGDVHAVRETVPALTVRSELVDATFLFARTAERDRVAALIAIER